MKTSRALLVLLPMLLLAISGGGTPQPSAMAAPEAATPPASEIQKAEAARTGWPLEFTNDLGMAFRIVAPGTLTMGSPENEQGRGAEPEHEVHLVRPYYLGTTEVTNAWYRAFDPGHSSGEGADGGSLDGDDQPVVGVSWQDAVRFAAWLTERDPRVVYRLPTEAEWEWACRAGTTSPFSSGGCASAAHAMLDCEDGTRPPGSSGVVGARAPNPWGFHDLHGNAAEWCHDWFSDYPLWRQDNPQGASSGTERVIRGGSWADVATNARSAARAHHVPDHCCPTVGFRLAFGLSYGRCEYGKHEVVVETYDPTVEDKSAQDRPGWPVCSISVIDRLTDRVNRIEPPRWTDLAEKTPLTLHLAPGIYYVFCYREEDGKRVKSIEMKFAVPGPDVVRCPIPRQDQAHPQ